MILCDGGAEASKRILDTFVRYILILLYQSGRTRNICVQNDSEFARSALLSHWYTKEPKIGLWYYIGAFTLHSILKVRKKPISIPDCFSDYL